TRSRFGVWSIPLLGLASCSGGHSGPTTGQSFFSAMNLAVVGHTPADDELQVATSATVMLRFDGIVAPDSLQQPSSGLFTAAGVRTPGAFVVTDGGRTVSFVPQGGLAKNEHYTFRLSPLTCDTSGRLLDQDFAFTFHAFDDRPPAIAT